MKQSIVIVLLGPVLFLANVITALENAATVQTVSDGEEIMVSLKNHYENYVFKHRINLAPSSRVTITVTDVPSNISFILLQIHTYQYNATLAYANTLLDKVSNGSLFGSNIGLYLKTYNVQAPIQAFLKHDNVHILKALLVIVPYGPNAPIPGGCNMEFNIEIAPFQRLRAGTEMIIVDTQPASVPAANFICDKSPVQHKMYRLYLASYDFSSKKYFEAIMSMLITQDIIRNGDEIPPAHMISPMRRIYSTYIGTGSVYAAIATYGNYSAAYVPTFTYACCPLDQCDTSCQISFSPISRWMFLLVTVIVIICIIKGNINVIFNHVLPSAMMSGTLGYIIAVCANEHGTAINILIALICALIWASLWAFLQRYRRSSGFFTADNISIYLLLENLPFGFLCACITYLYTPAWMAYVLETDWLFWPMFVSLAITIGILLTTGTFLSLIAGIITRTIFVAYCMIFVIDSLSVSHLKYIIITFIRRITVPAFRCAFVYPPYNYADTSMIILWVLLVIILCIRCYYQYRKDVVESETQSLLPAYRITYSTIPCNIVNEKA